jgi:ferric-dicitrate binding protein FerR (iron transport regulator)
MARIDQLARTLTLAVGFFLWIAAAHAQNPQMGQAQFAVGTLLVIHPDGIEDRLRGKGAVNLFEQDVVKTDAGSRALIELADGIRIALDESTTLILLSRWEKATGVHRIVRLKNGHLWVKGPTGGKTVEVETSSGTAVVQNGEIDIKAGENGQSVLSVTQGTAQFATSYGWCTVAVSTASTGARGRGCGANAPINAQQTLAWSRELLR